MSGSVQNNSASNVSSHETVRYLGGGALVAISIVALAILLLVGGVLGTKNIATASALGWSAAGLAGTAAIGMVIVHPIFNKEHPTAIFVGAYLTTMIVLGILGGVGTLSASQLGTGFFGIMGVGTVIEPGISILSTKPLFK